MTYFLSLMISKHQFEITWVGYILKYLMYFPPQIVGNMLVSMVVTVDSARACWLAKA